MSFNIRKILILLFLVVSFLGLRFTPAIACVLLPLPTVLGAYEQADVVVIARLISIERTKEPDPVHLGIRSATMGGPKGVQRECKGARRYKFRTG